MLSIPNFSQMITTLTSISRVLPQCIIAPPISLVSIPTWGLSMQLTFTYTMPSERPFFQLPRTLHKICFYHPDLPIPAAGVLQSYFLPRSAVILELPALAHTFLFLTLSSPTSEDFGIQQGFDTLPHELQTTDLEN